MVPGMSALWSPSSRLSAVFTDTLSLGSLVLCPFCGLMMDDCDSALIILFIIIVTIYASGLFQLQVLYLLVELSLTSLFISCNV
jgi:hypothetical protein